MNEFVDLGNPYPSFPFPLSCLFLCRKLHLFLGKSTKTVATTAALFGSNIWTKSFVGWGFAPYLTGGSLQRSPDLIAVFRGPTSKGKGRGKGAKEKGWEEREGSSSFALGRKNKSRRL